MALRHGIIAFLLVAGISAAEAATPIVSPGDLPGRERYRFMPSPLDRFMQPQRPPKPLLRWDCNDRGAWRAKRSKRYWNC